MKKNVFKIFIFALSLNAGFCQTVKQKFTIEKINFINENGFVNIKFNLVNVSNDTLFLSNENFNIELITKHKSIAWDYLLVHEQPFIEPVLSSGKRLKIKSEDLIIEDAKEKLITCFANKLFVKNAEINHKLLKYRKRIIQNIVNNCIILVPSEIYEFETYLYSKKFDKTCKVSVKYLDRKIFTCFVDDNGKKIDINN